MEEQERTGQEKSSRQQELLSGKTDPTTTPSTPGPSLPPKERLCWLRILVVTFTRDSGQAPPQEPS